MTALPESLAMVLREGPGISALIYRSAQETTNTAEAVEGALATMESGSLRGTAAYDMANQLRHMRHPDPVLGVVSSYLYDSIGDIDDIRRMAFYFVSQGVPIPYDIALLGQLSGHWRDGLLWAHVPAVSEGERSIDGEPRWRYSSTPARTGVVGGLWPWMRQGWTFLDDTAENGSLILPGLTELTQNLAPARFATLDSYGGHELAKMFHLLNKTQR
jgi:hypothetical protein